LGVRDACRGDHLVIETPMIAFTMTAAVAE
jgi:hypothetical protein